MSERYTQKRLYELLGVSQQAVAKQTKDLAFELEQIDGSDKRVKTYHINDLPPKWQEKLKGDAYVQTHTEELGDRNATKAMVYKSTESDNQRRCGVDDKNTVRAEKAKADSCKISISTEAKLKAKLCISYSYRSGTIEQFLSSLPIEFEGLKVNREKLLRWHKTYQNAIRNGTDGAFALEDNRGRPEGSEKLTQDMKNFVIRYLLRNDIRATNAGIYRNFQVQYGKTTVSYETVNRYIESYKSQNLFLYEFASNPDKAKGKYKPAVGSASEGATHKCAVWELDGTPADVITNDGQRWAVIGCIDVFSRRVTVTLEKKTSAFAVSRNLRVAIMKFGMPELVVTDNGRDYTSNHFDEVLLRLGISKREVPPYSGEMKPHIERFFGTMARALFREVEGFCGHDVAERQAIRNRKSFEAKLQAQQKWRDRYKNGDELAKAMLKRAKAGEDATFIEVPLSPEELRATIQNWIDNEYEVSLHKGINMTPKAKWKSCLIPPRGLSNERVLDLLMGQSRYYTISKEGIKFREDGKEFIYAAVELVGHVGKKVKCILPDEMSEIAVYDADSSVFICMAHDPAWFGGSREAAAIMQKEYKKQVSMATKASKEADKLSRELSDPTALSRTAPTPIQSEDMKEIRRVADTPAIIEAREAVVDAPLTGGRPAFETYTDRFVWAIENDDWNEKDQKLADKYPEAFEMAQNRVKKVG